MIKEVFITNLWDNRKTVSIPIKDKVTIISGFNGTGKSSILKIIAKTLSDSQKDRDPTLLSEEMCRWACRIFLEGSQTRTRYHFGPISKDQTEDKFIEDLDKTQSQIQSSESLNKYFIKKVETLEQISKIKTEKNNRFTTSSAEPSTIEIASITSSSINFPEIKTILFTEDDIFIANEKMRPEKRHNIIQNAIKKDINTTLYSLLVKFIGFESLSKDNNEKIKEIQDLIDNSDGGNSILKKKILEILSNKNSEESISSKFESVSNEFFGMSGKSITRDENNFIAIKKRNGEIVDALDLSRGEKVLLCLLIICTINHNKDNIIFLFDEPDLSLHIEWQEILIKSLLSIAPKAQFIFATHSPALVMDGWLGNTININNFFE